MLRGTLVLPRGALLLQEAYTGSAISTASAREGTNSVGKL